MKNTTLLLLLFISLTVLAQDYGDFKPKNGSHHIGQVSGKLIDAENGSPLAFANVRLFRTNDILLEGTITDESGSFMFDELALANGYLMINYMGYEETKIPITLNRNKKVEFLRKIKVKRSAVNLNEVSINEEKPIYESKMEKIVYNAENDLNESLDDASDVLRKTPLLSVDMDGNVSLRGSRGVKFLVNGKESTFFNGDAASALKMIPAEEVKSVEVITSPTAKYDGEGEAGIINIITNKKQITGFNATINGSVGTRVNRQSFNLNVGKGKFGISSRAMFRYGWKLPGESFSFRQNKNNGSTLLQISDTKGQWIGFGGNTEVYYDFNPYNSIITSLGYRGQRETSENSAQDSTYVSSFTNITSENRIDQIIDSLRAIQAIDINRFTDSKTFNNSLEWTTDYIKKFADHEDRELRLAFQLGGRIIDEDNKIFQNYQQNTAQDSVWNRNDGLPLTKTFQLDYTHPIEDKHTIELGAKYVDRDMITAYSTLDNGVYTQPYEQFDYNQKVIAAYLNTKWQLTKKYSTVVGLRMETTAINGQWNYQNIGVWEKNFKGKFVPDPYMTLLPNLIISRKIDMMSSIKASYSKRISRPGINYINTNTTPTDDFRREIGNPDLKPSLSHNLELGYNNFSGKYKGSYYLFTKYSVDLVEPFDSLNGDTSITTYRNIGENTSVGVNYYGSIKLGKLSLRAGFNLYTFQTTTEDIGDIQYNWNMGGNYDLGKGYKAETWGFFRSPTRTTQGYTPNFSMFSIGFKKEFKNKKGSIGLRFIDPFFEHKDFKSVLEGDDFYQYSNREVVFRSIGLSFKYTFGEMKFKAIKDKTGISNDDLMQGGDNSNEGGF